MANLYLQTIKDAKSAAESLKAMGSSMVEFKDPDVSFRGWELAEVENMDHEWSDGDWRYERTKAVISEDGRLWTYLDHQSYEKDRGSNARKDYTKLAVVTGEYLRVSDKQGGAFRKIRGAIKNLI